VVNVEVVIPYGRDDAAGRVAVRHFIVERYKASFPDWTITVTQCPSSRWSKGEAANPALLNSDADILVLADSDSYMHPRALEVAVEQAAGGAAWAVPFTLVKRITKGDTERILDGEQVPRPRIERQARATPGGGIVVATRQAWHTVNGVDPRFHGWGGEDFALGIALRALVGVPYTPPPLTLFHLWHPGKRRAGKATNELWRRYRRAQRQGREAVADLVKEW
jgi:hypothetical protein